MTDHSHPHVRIEADATSSSTSLADISGLSFPVEAGKKYLFGFLVRYDSAAASTGGVFALNGPAGTVSAIVSTPKATSGRNWYGLTAWNQPSSGTTAMRFGNLAVIDGEFLPTASGTVQARFASSKAGSAITTHGGTCWYQEL